MAHDDRALLKNPDANFQWPLHNAAPPAHFLTESAAKTCRADIIEVSEQRSRDVLNCADQHLSAAFQSHNELRAERALVILFDSC